ncbi:3-deoxy-D-manno-octulosonic acid transferase, partial [Acinetobacter baumannii]
THEGEETAICSIYKQLTGKYPHLKLIIVPRHPERFDRVQEVIESAGLSYSRFSRDKSLGGDTQVLLVDTMGQLLTLYSLSDI